MNQLTPQPPAVACVIYQKSDGKEFRQGEIISGVTQYIYIADEKSNLPVLHPFVVIASQDCDLLQDYEGAMNGKPSALNCVLLYEARPATELLTFFPEAKERATRKRIEGNKDERFHYLRAIPPEWDAEGVGIPDLIIDFRRLFAIQPSELLRQCLDEGATRRARLSDLYREHLQCRVAFYLQRVALPEQHSI